MFLFFEEAFTTVLPGKKSLNYIRNIYYYSLYMYGIKVQFGREIFINTKFSFYHSGLTFHKDTNFLVT